MEDEIPNTSKKERNFPSLELTDQTTLNATNQPLLVIQSPKTPTLSRKLKAVSLDSDPPQQENTLDISRDVFSMPNTPKRQIRQKLSCDFDDHPQKCMLAPTFSSNLKKFASNTSISGSQTLKTLPEVMTLQDFGDNRTQEPVKMKAKGLLERRGSNASLTIDLGLNPGTTEIKPTPVVRLNAAKSVSNLNLSTYSSLDKCTCEKICEVQTFEKKITERRKSQETCGNCIIYESVPSKPDMCKNKCQVVHSRCSSCRTRRKSLSNENLYVPPCGFCQTGSKECIGTTKHCKGYRKAYYPRQPDLESSQLLSEDFKMHLQNIQYLQTAGSILSVSELRSACEGARVPKLHQEFWEVPLNLQEKCYVSGSQSRNRYRGVLPNEHSRVHLPGNQTYIHANYIKGPDYTETAYIATQGPMAHTCEDFWDMIWHTHCSCIVMLTGLIEKGRNKCELYFPLGKKNKNPNEKSYFTIKTTRLDERFKFDLKNIQKPEEELVTYEELNEVKYGKHTIRYIREETLDECVVRELTLSRNDRSEVRKIYHYWYANWPDHKMANPEQVLKIALNVLNVADPHKKTDNNNPSNISLATCNTSPNSKILQQKPNESHCFSTKLLEQKSLDLTGDRVVKEVDSRNVKQSTVDFRLNKKQSSSFDFSSATIVVDCKVKAAQSVVDLKESIKRRRSFEQQQKVPVVVHCSAGIGRTGCFLAILNGIRQLRSNFNVDVLAILCSLRLNRGGMVQTAEQYELIHRVLSLYTDLM